MKDDHRDQASLDPMPSALDLRERTILVIDDNKDDQGILREMIRWSGADVRISASAAEALAYLLSVDQRPDLILCDLRMPEIDGFQFLERLRRDPHLARIPIIAVSVLGSPEDVMQTWNAGFQGHLVKPIDQAAMTAQLRRIFRVHSPRSGNSGSP